MFSGVGQDAASRQASRRTHSPIAIISPLSSAIGMNVPGGMIPRVGWRQRTKRLKAHDVPADQGLRLIGRTSSPPLNRRLQISLQCPPFAQCLIHFGFEKAHGAAAFGLRPIERGIGVAQERGRVSTVDRDRLQRQHSSRPAVFARSMLEVVDERRKPTDRRIAAAWLLRPSFDQQHELIATKSCEERTLCVRLQAVRGFASKSIATGMTEDVVDLLELIEIKGT